MILFLILITATVLAVSFICSMSEAVLLTLNPLDLKLQEKRGGKKCSAMAGDEKPDRAADLSDPVF
jgi:Mg2+/Co2+ transporter CorB